MKSTKLEYRDKVLARIKQDKSLDIEAFFLGVNKQKYGAIIAIPKPNIVSNSYLDGYRDYGYTLPPIEQTTKDFPSNLYSFWAINLNNIVTIITPKSPTYQLSTILQQLEDETK